MRDGVKRRALLRSGSAVVSLAAIGRFATEETAAGSGLTEVPEPLRSAEGGLTEFVAKWNAGGPILTGTRFGRFIVNRTFNIYVTDESRSWSLSLGPTGAGLTPGPDPTAHADVAMPAAEWERVLYQLLAM